MNKFLVIIKREYFTRVKSKGFAIGTILTPLLMVSVLLLPALIKGLGARSDYQLIVLDLTADRAIYDRAAELVTVENHRLGRFRVEREVVNQNQLDERRSAFNREIAEGRLQAYIVIPAAVLDQGRISYHAKNVGDPVAEARIEQAFNAAVVERRMLRSGVDVAQYAELNRQLVIDKFDERGEGEDWSRIITAIVLMGTLCLTILAYGSSVMSAVIEEKQTRTMEVLISSVKPFTLMMGKLIGVGLVGLTQYVIWAVSALLLSSLAAAQLFMGVFKMPQIPISLMAFFIIYFVLGYFLYATLYALLGSIVSNEEDGQQVQFPLMLVIMLAPLAASFVWRKPDLLVTTLISLFPFSSPFAMFLRTAIQEPPLWQVGLSIVLILGTTLGAVWLAGKFYRVGALMYGKRPTLPEVVKWMKYS